MARDLGDVLHYFLPELDRRERPLSGESQTRAVHRTEPPIPILGVAIGDSDVVRAALLWNLCIEIMRLGGRGVLVAPKLDASTPLWPAEGIGPMGAEVCLVPAENLGELEQAATAIASDRAARTRGGGVVLTRIPPRWLIDERPGSIPDASHSVLLRWILLFTSSEHRDQLETYGIAKHMQSACPGARIGITIHGARSVAEAGRSFAQLARASERHLGARLTSYGMLVDDLHVYRAIVARRAIGLEHPQSSAAKALQDVARMLLADANESLDE